MIVIIFLDNDETTLGSVGSTFKAPPINIFSVRTTIVKMKSFRIIAIGGKPAVGRALLPTLHGIRGRASSNDHRWCVLILQVWLLQQNSHSLQ